MQRERERREDEEKRREGRMQDTISFLLLLLLLLLYPLVHSFTPYDSTGDSDDEERFKIKELFFHSLSHTGHSCSSAFWFARRFKVTCSLQKQSWMTQGPLFLLSFSSHCVQYWLVFVRQIRFSLILVMLVNNVREWCVSSSSSSSPLHVFYTQH